MTPPDATFARCQRRVTPLLRLLYRLEVRGAELVPPAGPLVVAANHESVLDPFVLAAAIPRPLRYLAKEELWRTRWLGRAMDALGAIPVRRGRVDTGLIETATAALARGEAIAIFPQGGIRREGAWLRGAARLAIAAQATLVPVRLLGTAAAIGRGRAGLPRLAVLVGEPLPLPPPSAGGSAAARSLTRLLQERVAALST